MGGYRQVNAFSSGFGRDHGHFQSVLRRQGRRCMFNGEFARNPYWVSRYAPQMRYGVAPVPPPAAIPDAPARPGSAATSSAFPSESRHPQEAWDFMVWMQSTEAQVMFAHDMNNVPNRRAALQSPRAAHRAAVPHTLRALSRPGRQPAPASSRHCPSRTSTWTRSSTAIDQVLSATKRPQQALAEVRVRVQKELDHQPEVMLLFGVGDWGPSVPGTPDAGSNRLKIESRALRNWRPPKANRRAQPF